MGVFFHNNSMRNVLSVLSNCFFFLQLLCVVMDELFEILRFSTSVKDVLLMC